MFKLSLKTVKAYHIRENFQEIYKEAKNERFEKSLKKWYFWATHTGQAYCGVRPTKINNGIREGLHSLAAKVKARGYRIFRNMKAIVYLLTGNLDYSEVGLPA